MKRNGLANERSGDCAAATDAPAATATAVSASNRTFSTDTRIPPSAGDHAPMQPRNGVEGGQDRTFLPGRQIGGVLAGERDASVDRAQILVVLLAGIGAPDAVAAEHPGPPVPADRHAILVFGRVLRVDLRAVFEGFLQPLLGSQRGELVGVGPGRVGGKQHALAGTAVVGARIGDLPDRQIGVADAAVYGVVLLPEAAPELQADLDRRRV